MSFVSGHGVGNYITCDASIGISHQETLRGDLYFVCAILWLLFHLLTAASGILCSVLTFQDLKRADRRGWTLATIDDVEAQLEAISRHCFEYLLRTSLVVFIAFSSSVIVASADCPSTFLIFLKRIIIGMFQGGINVKFLDFRSLKLN